MQARTIVIVTTGQAALVQSLELDALVAAAIQQKRRVILVLGPDGDDFLRVCKRIDDCEIVFDPNYNGGFFSGVKAGLSAATSAAIVVRISPQRSVDATRWQHLDFALGTAIALTHDIVLAPPTLGGGLEATAAQWDCVLVTLKGLKTLRETPADADWQNLPCTNSDIAVHTAALTPNDIAPASADESFAS